MEEIFVTDRLRLLLDHFGDVGDPRAAAKVQISSARGAVSGHLRDDRGVRR